LGVGVPGDDDFVRHAVEDRDQVLQHGEAAEVEVGLAGGEQYFAADPAHAAVVGDHFDVLAQFVQRQFVEQVLGGGLGRRRLCGGDRFGRNDRLALNDRLRRRDRFGRLGHAQQRARRLQRGEDFAVKIGGTRRSALCRVRSWPLPASASMAMVTTSSRVIMSR
jgi:hypothetical protein